MTHNQSGPNWAAGGGTLAHQDGKGSAPVAGFPANNGWTQYNGMQILAYFIGSSSPRRWRSSPDYCRRRPSPEMNGEPLNVLHGAPPRVHNELVLGFKQVKWIQAIEFAESRPPPPAAPIAL